MAYVNVAGSDNVKDSRQVLLDRDEALRACFAATSFPTDPAPLDGQLCYRSDLGVWYGCIDSGTPTWVPLGTSIFLPMAGGVMSGFLGLAKGANIASAATINLNAATGNLVHITGATGINTVTLTAGYQVLAIFDGAPLITLSANLRGPPTNNTGTIQMAAGDMALFVGDGSGVTRIAQVFRISGQAVNDARYQLADGSRAFTNAPVVTGAGRTLYAASGNDANSGKVSWGTGAPGTLAEGEVYLRHA
jgi:hypothetical protein